MPKRCKKFGILNCQRVAESESPQRMGGTCNSESSKRPWSASPVLVDNYRGDPIARAGVQWAERVPLAVPSPDEHSENVLGNCLTP
jgi:hypothetical protein